MKARSYQFLHLSVSFNDTNRDTILFFSKKERCCSIDYFMICRHFKPLGSFFCIFSRLFREQRKPNSTSLTIHKRQQSRSRAAFFKATLYLLYIYIQARVKNDPDWIIFNLGCEPESIFFLSK